LFLFIFVYFLFGLEQQDISKRLSLPADLRIPESFLAKQSSSSPIFDGPLTRTNRRQSLSEIGFGRMETYTKLDKLGEVSSFSFLDKIKKKPFKFLRRYAFLGESVRVCVVYVVVRSPASLSIATATGSSSRSSYDAFSHTSPISVAIAFLLLAFHSHFGQRPNQVSGAGMAEMEGEGGFTGSEMKNENTLDSMGQTGPVVWVGCLVEVYKSLKRTTSPYSQGVDST
jgi:hypothetical protein